VLALRPRPSAVFAASDEMAYGAIRAIQRAGLTVADDVAVSGFDDHATAELLDLSSVRRPVTEQGVRLARALLAARRCAAELKTPACGASSAKTNGALTRRHGRARRYPQ
jgi:LacI family repressor for deo operon, udp, cdd, tsx, nupC, and nupG